ncbi:hypothetical protein ACHAQA_001920 [Verticillium albo-atrum]
MPLVLRDGTPADIPALVTVFLAAFASEPLITATHPHADRHPSHPHLYYRRFFEARIWGPEQQILRVAVDPATDRPVAFAWFRRHWPAPTSPADRAARAAHDGPLTARFWLAPPVNAARALATWLWPCLSSDPVVGAAFGAMHGRVEAQIVRDDPSPPRRSGAWYLSTLAVDPSLQGQGTGSWLVRDVLTGIIDPEGAACWLIGLEGVEPFYERFGFKEIGRANEGDLADWTGGAVMMRE